MIDNNGGTPQRVACRKSLNRTVCLYSGIWSRSCTYIAAFAEFTSLDIDDGIAADTAPIDALIEILCGRAADARVEEYDRYH